MERGAVGLETGIMLIAPVVVAATVGAGLMRVGDVASRNAQSAVFDAIQGVGSGIQSNGLLLARTDGTRVTHLLVDVTATPGGPSERLDSHAVIEGMTVSYIDSETVERNVPYSVTWIGGNSTAGLDSSEVAEIDVDLSRITTRDRFTVEIRPPRGAYVSLQVEVPSRTALPPVLLLD